MSGCQEFRFRALPLVPISLAKPITVGGGRSIVPLVGRHKRGKLPGRLNGQT